MILLVLMIRILYNFRLVFTAIIPVTFLVIMVTRIFIKIRKTKMSLLRRKSPSTKKEGKLASIIIAISKYCCFKPFFKLFLSTFIPDTQHSQNNSEFGRTEYLYLHLRYKLFIFTDISRIVCLTTDSFCECDTTPAWFW